MVRLPVVPSLDTHAGEKAMERQGYLTKPAGSLGALERVPIVLARIQGATCPESRPAGALIFACDHPVAHHGVSAYPSQVTAAMMSNFATGGAAASVLARATHVDLTIVDVGVEFPYTEPPQSQVLIVRDVSSADVVGDLCHHDAMSLATYDRCWGAGTRAVERLPLDVKILMVGEIGIGNTTAAASLAAGLLNRPASDMVGAGTGVGGATLDRKILLVDRALRRVGTERTPSELLRRLGGRDLVAMAGAMAHAVERRMVILVDGFVASVAALALCRLAPTVRDFLIFSHRSAERGHDAVLHALDAIPLLDLGLRLGEASGALLAFPLLDLACALHNQMATFDSANVPTRLDPGCA